MATVLRRFLSSYRPTSIFSSSINELRSIVGTNSSRYFHQSRYFRHNDDGRNSPPLIPEQRPTMFDKYLIPPTVMATGAIHGPGIVAMAKKPVHLWIYRRYYDLTFDTNEFMAGARRALYFVADKAFRKDFTGLMDVMTPEAMSNLRELVREDSFRLYLDLHASSTPVLYERIGAAGFLVQQGGESQENDHIQYYGDDSSSSNLPQQQFEILVFFVCKIERLLSIDSTKASEECALAERSGGRVKNYYRLLVMMTFSRLLERTQEQSSDWLVSSMALIPIQFTFDHRWPY